jgi:hypothetical protein
MVFMGPGVEYWRDVAGVNAETAQKLAQAAERMHMTIPELADWAVEATADHDIPPAPLTEAERQFLDDHSGISEEALARAHSSGRTSVEGPAQQRARLLASSLTAKEAAERLGIGADAIRHRIGKSQLWSVRISGRHRIPMWQFMPFDTDELVPDGDWAYEVRDDENRKSMTIDVPNFSAIEVEHGSLWFDDNVDHSGLAAQGQAPLLPPQPQSVWATLPGLERVVPSIPEGSSPLSVQGFMATEQDELRADGRLWKPVRWLQEGFDPEPVARLVADLGQIW